MTERDDRIVAPLRRMAEELEGRAPAISVEEVSSRGAGPRRRPLRVLAAAAVVVAAAASVWAVTDDDGRQTTVVGPGPEAPAPTAEQPSSTEDPAADPASTDWFDWDAMPTEGIAVLDEDGILTLHDLVGDVLAAGPYDGEVDGPALWVQPGEITPASVGMAEVPPGCASAATAGGVRVARCGDDPDESRRVDLVDPAGTSVTILDGVPWGPGGSEPELGHWRRALPSGDGKWVLAEWSGECEIPEAVLVEVSTGDVHPVARPVGDLRPSSRAIGWSRTEGRAVVVLPDSPCGTTAGETGVQLLDPATGRAERILPPPEPDEQVFHWTKRAYGNDAEWLVRDAIDALGLEGCCGEPSHGGPGVTSGAVFEGQEIGISGFADDVPPGQTVVGEPQAVPFLHGEATVSPISGGGPYPGDRLVSFRCGGFTWRLSWWEDGPAEVDSMLLLGEALVPHLGCTLVEPPA